MALLAGGLPLNLRLVGAGNNALRLRLPLAPLSSSTFVTVAASSLSASSILEDNEAPQLVFDGVVENGNRMRLDTWLASQLPSQISRARVQSSIRSGFVHVNGQSVDKVSYAVRSGDHIKCAIAALTPLKANPEDIPLDIVFEDDHLLVVNKPAQMVTHPAPGNWHGTLVNALVHHCELPDLGRQSHSSSSILMEEDNCASDEDDELVDQATTGDIASASGQVPLSVRPGIVHRLDKGTSGLLVIAKDEHAHESLSKQFKDRTIIRTYLSLTCGVPRSTAGIVDADIGRDIRNRTRMAVIRNSGSGIKARHAISSYKVVEVLASGGSALVEWKLQTGRTHQIRVHAQHIGNPLLGDELYGGTKGAALSCILPKIPSTSHGLAKRLMSNLERPYLHAATLGFRHPTTLKELSFTCDPPFDFKELLNQLQKLK